MLLRLLPELAGKRALEIGCGSGRLTRKYAGRASHVLAIDTDAAAVEAFRRSMPIDLRGTVDVRTAEVGRLDPGDARFDLVLLSWAL
jgi:2-polyprenyl-3-methyl-5-hydroxy-6-metoxy-1,4-benzoquinol methylase